MSQKIIMHASSYARRLAKVGKSEHFTFHYKNPLGRPLATFWHLLNLNFYSNCCFEFEFASEFGTYILHIPWSQSQTNDLSASVRTFFKKKLPFIFLSPPAREQAIIHILLP
jgi:hypothetical protein